MLRKDGIDFLELAAKIPIQTEIHCYPFSEVNFTGAAVIRVDNLNN